LQNSQEALLNKFNQIIEKDKVQMQEQF